MRAELPGFLLCRFWKRIIIILYEDLFYSQGEYYETDTEESVPIETKEELDTGNVITYMFFISTRRQNKTHGILDMNLVQSVIKTKRGG